MAEEPIRKEDIIDIENTVVGIRQLIDGLEQLNDIIKRLKDDSKKEALNLFNSVQGINPASPEGQAAMKNFITQVEQLQIVTKEQNKVEKETLALKTKLKLLSTDEAKNIAQLKVAIENKNKALKEAARLDDSAEGSINKMRARLKELIAEYNRLGASARKEVAPAIKKVTDELKKAESAIGNNTRNVGNYSSAWKGAGRTLLSAAGIVGGATMVLRSLFRVVKEGFKTSIDFEYAMSQVRAVARASGDEFESLRQNAISLGSATKFTATEVAGLQKEYAKLGFTVPEILKITAATLDLAAATGSDLAYAATIAGATLRQFGMGAHEMQRVVDVMTLSFNASALDMDKFAIAMQNAGPVAKAVGETIESTAAKLAVLANSGLDASMSGTSLRNIFLELEKRGLTWNQAMNKINGSQQKASTSLELFGKRGAVAGVILADNIELADEFAESFNNAAGSAKEMADIMLDNVTGSATILKSAWEGFILRTNESNGALKDFIDILTNLVTAINTKGKPAIDSMFDVRTIETFSDKWKFYAAQGIGLWATLANSVIRSRKETQGYSDELSSVMIKEKARIDEIEKAKSLEAAAEKARNDERLKQINAEVEASERAAEEKVKADKEAYSEMMKSSKDYWRDYVKIYKEDEKRNKEKEKNLHGFLDMFKRIQNETVEASKTASDAIGKYEKKKLEEKIKAEEEYEDLKKQRLVESLTRIGESLSVLSDLYEANKQKELSAAGDNAAKREEIERKYLKKQQTLSIGQALINGAIAITEIWAKWAKFPILAGIFTALSAATTLAQVAIIKSQKFAKGGSGVLEGPSHARGGINVGIGEAEGGEHISITSRKMTSKYGPKVLDAVANSINQGKFFEVWANVSKEMQSDPYTKKMYDLMLKTPTVYKDTSGDTVKEYPDGKKYIIKRFYKN